MSDAPTTPDSTQTVNAALIGCTDGLERIRLRAAQSEAVMPLIGGLLDAWDGLPNDLKCDDELEHVRDYIEKINAAMEA